MGCIVCPSALGLLCGSSRSAAASASGTRRQQGATLHASHTWLGLLGHLSWLPAAAKRRVGGRHLAELWPPSLAARGAGWLQPKLLSARALPHLQGSLACLHKLTQRVAAEQPCLLKLACLAAPCPPCGRGSGAVFVFMTFDKRKGVISHFRRRLG